MSSSAGRVSALPPMPRYCPVVATLTLAGLRVSEFCALNCEHVDLARRELRVLDAKTPAGVRRVDIHDDLQEELAAYKAARGETWQAGEPAFLNARGKRWTRKRNRTACNPACTGRNQSPADRGRAPRHPRGGHRTRAAVHLHCLALRRGRRSGVRCRPGRARRHHDNQPHLPLRPTATPARRDRPTPPVGDARVSRGHWTSAKLARANARALSCVGHARWLPRGVSPAPPPPRR